MSTHKIQSYIDLWEGIPADTPMDRSQSVLVIPKKNPRRSQPKNSDLELDKRQYHTKGENFVVTGVPAEDQRTTPAMLQQIRTTLENWSPPTPPQDHDDEPLEILKSSPDTTEAPDTPPDSLDYAATFRSIAMGNPFSTPSLKRAASFSSRVESSVERLPFTPDELWNFHRPPPPSPPPTLTTQHSRTACINKTPGREVQGDKKMSMCWPDGSPPMKDTITMPSDFTYEQSVPYQSQSPESYTFEAPPALTLNSRSRESFDFRRSKTFSILNLDSSPISTKAAKMLGIDLSATITPNWSPTQSNHPTTDLPDRYNFHRTRPAASPHTRSISLPTWATANAFSHTHIPPLSAIPQVSYDATLDATRVWKALKKSKKLDTDLLSETLVAVSHQPSKLPHLKQKYRELYGDDLGADIRAATSGHYRTSLARLLAGPHEAEAQALKKNDSMYFLDEKLMAEALFGKSPDDIKQIKIYFEQSHELSLKTVLENLHLFSPVSAGLVFSSAGASASLGRACLQALKAERDVESVEMLAVMHQRRLLERERRLVSDVELLYQSHGGPKYLNQKALLDIVLQRSDLYLAELCRRFYERHGKELAELVLAKDKMRMLPGSYYPYGVGYAVAFALNGAINRPHRDARLLEDCMKGLGTRDSRLIARITRIHFDQDPRHVDFVREIYEQRFGRKLADRVKENTKGPYCNLLLKILEGRGAMAAESLY